MGFLDDTAHHRRMAQRRSDVEIGFDACIIFTVSALDRHKIVSFHVLEFGRSHRSGLNKAVSSFCFQGNRKYVISTIARRETTQIQTGIGGEFFQSLLSFRTELCLAPNLLGATS